MTGLEYALETITMLTNIIISNDAIERFLKCMVCVFTTTVVIPARIPVEITFGKRMGKRGFLLTEGQQKGGMYTIELEQDLNRNTNATKSKSDPKVAWKRRRTRERPYNFRLLEIAKMGIGYRINFMFLDGKPPSTRMQIRMVMMSLMKGGLLASCIALHVVKC